MAQLGALMLSSVLLGLSRVFRGRSTVARRRTRYVEPARSDEALLDFIAALRPAIDDHCRSLVGAGTSGASVVEVHRLQSQAAEAGRPSVQAISVSVEADGCIQRLVLHGLPGRHADAARSLVHWLGRDPADATRPRISSGPVWV